MNLQSRIPKVPNIAAKACLGVVCYLWLGEVVRSGMLYPGERLKLYLAQVILCGIAVAAASRHIAILAGVSGCVSLFLFVREYSDVLFYLKLQRELDAFYQAGR
ncbi:hypothetical protein [Prosthecobacter sp.]|uniref:hypothetical protein n=1 Tax=Prosthecobacter sp. TaxID=1965333 RepID=UPI002488A5E9|nr:hypothetical protein [Prosthecobacter sp.]MDI1315509.1 hypothetical protein [Prosthecobacter sp.]